MTEALFSLIVECPHCKVQTTYHVYDGNPIMSVRACPHCNKIMVVAAGGARRAATVLATIKGLDKEHENVPLNRGYAVIEPDGTME